MKRNLRKWIVIVAVAGVTGFSGAGELSRLPKAMVLPAGEGSPGPVTFNHDSHVDLDAPRCVNCHPLAFSILQRASATSGRRITHEGMEKRKESCGACHGGKAFGFDDCTMCHQM